MSQSRSSSLIAAFAEATQSGTIHHNVTVYGVGVGGLTVTEATLKLERVEPRGGAVTLIWGGRHWSLSAAALHARLNAAAAARDAYDYTRTGNVLARAWTSLWLWFSGHSVQPAVTLPSRAPGSGSTRSHRSSTSGRCPER